MNALLQIEGKYLGGTSDFEQKVSGIESMYVNANTVKSVSWAEKPGKDGNYVGQMQLDGLPGDVEVYSKDPRQLEESLQAAKSDADKASPSVLLGDGRLFMEEPSGCHYTRDTDVDLASVIMMRGDKDNPVVYVMDSERLSRMYATKSMNDIVRQADRVNALKKDRLADFASTLEEDASFGLN